MEHTSKLIVFLKSNCLTTIYHSFLILLTIIKTVFRYLWKDQKLIILISILNLNKFILSSTEVFLSFMIQEKYCSKIEIFQNYPLLQHFLI